MRVRILCLLGIIAAFTWLLSNDAANDSIAFSDALQAPDRMVAAQATPQPPDRRIRKLREELPYLQSGPVEPASVGALAAPELVAWSQLVFQSYRDGNWEIYRANGDGSHQTRLTADGGTDIYPRLNRGCTRIVFVSNRRGNYEVFTMDPNGSGLARLTSTEANETRPAWSPDGARIAFASYRDGQSEIYIMNADGTGQKRLTWDSGYDGEPAWSPDGTRIAFASTRTGDYRIWVMNADGSGQRQLSDQAVSEYPAWSPDGSRIAYDADGNGDGWQELWLMNADGTDQHPVYDPPESQTDAWAGSWSADGRYVAFTRISLVYHQGNWYWTTAYLDAWDSRDGGIVRLSNSGEDWNPDWGSLDATPPSSQMNPLPSQSPSPIPVSWSGVDTGPAGLHNYDVQVRDGSGAWMDWRMGIAATSAQYPVVGGHTYFFRVRARDTAGNLEAWPADYDAMTRVEALPPQTVVEPLPAYVRGTAVTVSWTGSDPGGSGIEKYDVQVRDSASGPWTDWQTGTITTEAEFTGELGHIYSFRSRGTDRAQNLEPWPPGDGDASTTLYASSLTSTVTDNRDAPLSGVILTIAPPHLGVVSDGAEGTYVAYFAEDAETRATSWSKAGYTSLPPTSLLVAQDLRFDAFLPPGDNVVANWGFEEGSSGWTASGEIMPVVTDTMRHTGQQAALLGTWRPAFQSVVNVSNTPGFSATPAMGLDSAGIVHVVWVDWTTGYGDVYYAQRDAAGQWSTPISLETGATAGTSGSPQLAVEPDGALQAIWTDWVSGSGDIFYARRSNDGIWSPPQQVAATPGESGGLRLVMDAASVLHIAWSDWTPGYEDVYYLRREANGTWSAPINVSQTIERSIEADLAVDQGGAAHLVWSDCDSELQQCEILYARRSGDGMWSDPKNISNNSGLSHLPRLASDGSDTLHVLWADSASGEQADVYYARRTQDGLWSAPENISQTAAHSEGAQIAIDLKDQLHVVWLEGLAPDRQLLYRMRSADGSWSPPEQLAGDGGSAEDPHLGVDDSNILHVVWTLSADILEGYYSQRSPAGWWTEPENVTGTPGLNLGYVRAMDIDGSGAVHLAGEGYGDYPYDIFYAGPLPLMEGGDSSLAQTVAVPAGASAPTLSLTYKLAGASATSGNWLRIQATGSVNKPPLFSTTTNTGAWTHAWFDMSPWAGETVTLTLAVRQTPGTPATYALIDEVTLGSAYPDTWVDKQGPLTAPPGGPLTYTIRYGNRGGVLANGVHITDALPAELENWDATPYPDVIAYPLLTWNVGDLGTGSTPAEIVLQASVKPDVIPFRVFTNTVQIASASPELELANNVAEACTMPAYYVYLPLVMR